MCSSDLQVYHTLVQEALGRRRDQQALVGMGHCYIVGGEPSLLSERKVQVGHQSALPVELFPKEFAYVALGHLHLPQAIAGRPEVRYAGSPLPLDIAERRYPHAVSLLHLDGAQLREVKQLRTPRTVELRRLPDEGGLTPLDLLSELRQLPRRTESEEDRQWPLLELAVLLDKPEPGLRALIAKELEDKAVRWVKLKVQLSGTGAGWADGQQRRLEDLTPDDVFAAAWRQRFGTDPDEACRSGFRQLHAWAQDPDLAAQARVERAAGRS